MTEGRPHPVTGAQFTSPVPPGSGWPDDRADAQTPVARSAAGVRRWSALRARSESPELRAPSSAEALDELGARVSVCRACPRLVRWREGVANEKRAAFADQPYWGRPVPGWGDPTPRVLLVGLAPAAHGANRTGRVFTGDRSGDWLFAALHRVGLAALPTSAHAGDGQRLLGTRLVAAVRCAPPANKPSTAERDACSPWLERELELVAPSLRAVVALGAFGWDAALRSLAAVGFAAPPPRPRFSHGATATLTRNEHHVALLGCYHPSQQNTFTGRLTEPMLDVVLARAASIAGLAG